MPNDLIISTAGDPLEPKRRGDAGFDALLKLARKRFRQCADAETQMRRESLEDLNFRAGKQWPGEIENDRTVAGRPCLTINRIPQFIKQVVNEQRQNRPAIQVNPVGDGADTDTAQILQGIVRHIEVNSHASVAYDTAFDHACTMGFGYFRILTEYVDERSFDQEILIKRIPDPFKVYFDPNAVEADYSDAKFAFIFDDLSKEEYESQFGDAEQAGLSNMNSIGDDAPFWFPEAKIRIAEYFWTDYEEDQIALLADGSVMPLANVPEGIKPRRTRAVRVPRVHWIKMNAVEVLEENDWPGKWIPIVPVLGDEIILEGRRYLVGMVRFARDSQRMFNYMISSLVETIALAPKAPFIAEKKQIENYEDIWEQANRRNYAYLPYEASVGPNGELIPPPQRSAVEPPIAAFVQAIVQMDNGLKATMGIYDASLGAPGPEQSGKAILARQKEGDIANYNLIDNLTRSLQHAGRIIIDLIPHVYDAPRVVRIIHPDDRHETIQINQPTLVQGIQKVYDVTVGRYDVTISVGPSYATKRIEAVNSMLQLVGAYPALMQIAGDLLVSNMDWNGAKEIAERLKAMLPPQFQQIDPSMPIPPAVRAQLMQLMQQNQSLQQALTQALDVLKTKKLELDSKERVAYQGDLAGIVEALIRAKSGEAQTLANLDYKSVQHQLDLLSQQPPEQQPPNPQPPAPAPEQQPPAPMPQAA